MTTQTRREARWEYLRGALWVIPAVSVVLALVAGSILSLVEVPTSSPLHRLVFQGTADDARTLLIGIAGTMITVVAVVLGLTIVALQLASTQFSPRLLRNFLRDLPNQIVLGVFVGTFAYSTAGLYTVGISQGQRTAEFPRLAVTGALVLLFASLMMLVFFVHHLSHSIQIDDIMRRVERSTLRVIANDLPRHQLSEQPLPEPPVWAVAVPAHRSGYVQTLHPELLVESAVSDEVVVQLVPMVGEHVVSGAPLAWLSRASPEQPPPEPASFAATLQDAVRIGYERTSEQDVALGIRQLADIASKALSPAVNDPYTATQAIEHLAVIVSTLAQRPLGSQVVADEAGRARVLVPARDFAYYLDLTCGQPRRYGSSEPRVMRALLRMLNNVGRFCLDDRRRAAVVREVRLVVEAAETSVSQRADLEPVLAQAEDVLRAVGG